MKHQHPAPGGVAWARGMAVTAAVATGLFIVWPVAAALRVLWRWA